MIVKYCPTCGAPAEEDAAFCTRCGVAFAQVVAPAPVITSDQPKVFSGGYVPVLGDRLQQTAVAAGPPGSRFIGQWNWGASLMGPLWLMNHRRSGWGVALLLINIIPIVNFFTSIGAIVYLGLNGTKIAVESGRFTSEESFVAVQNAWRNWAFGIMGLFVVVGIIEGITHLAK